MWISWVFFSFILTNILFLMLFLLPYYFYLISHLNLFALYSCCNYANLPSVGSIKVFYSYLCCWSLFTKSSHTLHKLTPQNVYGSLGLQHVVALCLQPPLPPCKKWCFVGHSPCLEVNKKNPGPGCGHSPGQGITDLCDIIKSLAFFSAHISWMAAQN